MAFNLILTVKPTFKLMQRQNNKIQIYIKVFLLFWLTEVNSKDIS